jgi:hypothetical protein
MGLKTSLTGSSSPSTSETVNASCPTCEAFSDLVLKQGLTPLKHVECLDLRSLFQDKTYKLYQDALRRSMAAALRDLRSEEGNKVYHAQGRMEQLETIYRLPQEIEYLISKYEELDQQQRKEQSRAGSSIQ